MEVPDNKRLEYALPYIHGIGRARARQIISELNMENKLAKNLTKREVYVIGEHLSKYVLGKELVKICCLWLLLLVCFAYCFNG